MKFAFLAKPKKKITSSVVNYFRKNIPLVFFKNHLYFTFVEPHFDCADVFDSIGVFRTKSNIFLRK